MASSSGSNGTNAGIVAVEIRGDLSALERDLKSGAKMADQFAAQPRPAAPVSPADSSRSKRDYTESLREMRQAEMKELGFAAREARRDARADSARLIDQIGDTSMFSAQSLVDRLFGMDEDKIAARRAYQTIGDLEGQFQRGEISLAQLDEKAREHRETIAGLDKKYSGLGGAMRGVGAALLSSFASSVLIAGGIGLASAALEGLVALGGQMWDRLVNPAKEAAAAFNGLADAVNKAGGSESFIKFYNLSGDLAELARSADRGNAAKGAWEATKELLAAQGAGLAFGMSPEDAMNADKRREAAEAWKKSFMLGPLLTNPEGINRAFDQMTREQQAEVTKRAPYGFSDPGVLVDVMADILARDLNAKVAAAAKESARLEAEAKRRETADREAAQAAREFAATMNDANQSARRSFELGNRLFDLTGNPKYLNKLDPDYGNRLDAKRLEGIRDRAQAALEAMQRSNAKAAENRQLADARRNTMAAGIGVVGMTAYDVAGKFFEASQQEKELARQIAEQRKQTELLDFIKQTNEQIEANTDRMNTSQLTREWLTANADMKQAATDLKETMKGGLVLRDADGKVLFRFVEPGVQQTITDRLNGKRPIPGRGPQVPM